MRIMTITILLLFAFFTQITFAGVGVYEGSTNLGVSGNIKCSEGINCSLSGKYLLLKAQQKAVLTFASGDATPSVSAGSYFNSYTNNTVTITDFDDGSTGKEIIVYSNGPATYDVTSSGIKCGTTDVITASGDVTKFLYDGTDWQCTSRIDASDNLN